MAGLWLLSTSYCRLVWQIAWFLIWLDSGVDQNEYRVCKIRKRDDRTTKEREYRLPPTPSIWVLPSPYLAFSHIQIRMWFISMWADGQIYRAIVHKINNMSCESVINTIGVFMLAHVFHLFRKGPDKVYAIGDFIIIEPRTRGRMIRLLLLTVFIGLRVLSRTSRVVDDSDNETWQRLHSLKKELNEPLYALASKPRTESWGDDSIPIIVDTATTRTLTPRFDDLIDPIPHYSVVKGIGEGRITHKGKVRWTVTDDQGRRVILEDGDAYYSKNAPYRLLCPHSWKKHMNNKRYQQGETVGDQANMCLADDEDDGYILSWDRGKIQVSVPLDPGTNLPTIHEDGTYDSFRVYAAAFQCYPTVIPDDDDEDRPETMRLEEVEPQPKESTASKPRTVLFDMPENNMEKPINIDDPLTHHDKELFLSWHVKLGHTPFKNVKRGLSRMYVRETKTMSMENERW